MNIPLDAFVRPDDPVLSKIAERIEPHEVTGETVNAIISRMLRVAYGEQTERERPLLVGLAAPQIGISKRIILVDVAANGKGVIGDLRVFLNPEIVWSSPETNDWYEGCFSTSRVCGIVTRPTTVRVEAIDSEGRAVSGEYHGYTARIFQHEIDHLNGTEFVSRITDDDKLHWVEVEEFAEYRNREGWRNWPRKCPRKKWEQIKGIHP